MAPEFLNLYIERLLKEIEELTKNRLLIETQLKYTEKVNIKLTEDNKELEQKLNKLDKKKTKEVDTSDTF